MIYCLVLLFILTLLGVHYGQLVEPNIIHWGQSLPEGVMGRGLFYEVELLLYMIVALNVLGALFVVWAQVRGYKLRTFLSIGLEVAIILALGYYTNYEQLAILWTFFNPLILLVWAVFLAFMRLNAKQVGKTAYSSKSNW